MQKVGFFKSIHVKIVLIYVLLIINCNANNWSLFCSRTRRELKRKFQEIDYQTVDLLNIVCVKK